MRPSGARAAMAARPSSVTSRRTPSVPSTGPGARPFTRMPCGPHSTASVRVIESMPALAAAACTCPMVPSNCSVALMFNTTPRLAFRCGSAARETLNVPFRSMSTTVPKPLGDSSSARATKLPAAPFTTMSRRPNVSAACATAAATSSGRRTSAATASARTPSEAISAAVGSRWSAVRLTMATSQPCAARASAMPRQMPVPPPVTSAERPARSERSKAETGITRVPSVRRP